MKKVSLSPITRQVIGVVATAGVAASLAFLQSVAASNGLMCTPHTDPVAAGGIGMALKSGLDAIRLHSSSNLV